MPAVGVEVSGAASSAIPAFERSSLSTVDSIDNAPGQLALALVLAGGEKGTTGSRVRLPTASSLSSQRRRRPVADLTILVAARDEEERIGQTVRALASSFPGAEIVVADDGSRDGTAGAAEQAGARVVRLPRRGKGKR